ncbi:hypothetical protein BDK51DRAFT_48107 [Blyttiomyces helicus]|uniref:PLC-beta PH domain-containing protein n=1 Tax=Blyttiomyces helicus TaxID=388810 RepID=A0A4V1IPD7_9FUNG|nr:hypothetical protein BDK51DRAFT_48107 [Blyttiomyces helicus]|eukprot:RKO82697.1 hypothetical protein BDK51DRAFT_48107 [Blyttiomyces helicus]
MSSGSSRGGEDGNMAEAVSNESRGVLTPNPSEPGSIPFFQLQAQPGDTPAGQASPEGVPADDPRPGSRVPHSSPTSPSATAVVPHSASRDSRDPSPTSINAATSRGPSPTPSLTFDPTSLALLGEALPPPAPADPEHLQSILTQGTRMTKFPNKASSKPEERLIKVDLMPLQISWESRKKKANLSTVDFHSIREIRLGQNTKAFDVHGKQAENEERAFTIIYVAGGEYKMLNLGRGVEGGLNRPKQAYLRRLDLRPAHAHGAGRLLYRGSRTATS